MMNSPQFLTYQNKASERKQDLRGDETILQVGLSVKDGIRQDLHYSHD
jgi:hypothetical protein